MSELKGRIYKRELEWREEWLSSIEREIARLRLDLEAKLDELVVAKAEVQELRELLIENTLGV